MVGINNRVNAQVLAGLKQGDQVVIADSSENSATSANSGNNRRRSGQWECKHDKTSFEVSNLVREFPAGESTILLKGIDLTIYEGELVAIVGQSGSGKSTLMNILGCLDRPTSGSYKVNGQETGKLEPDQLAQLRREYFGFIFQRYHLLGDLSAEGNVEVPAVCWRCYSSRP